MARTPTRKIKKILALIRENAKMEALLVTIKHGQDALEKPIVATLGDYIRKIVLDSYEDRS